jgi:integrase
VAVRIALDAETVVLLRKHKQRAKESRGELGVEWIEDVYLFTGPRRAGLSNPYSPDAISSRYNKIAARLDISKHLHALRHYSATE